ncbi:glycerol-3-phosphate dehydrogenase/oxidase [Mucilaginibacter rubeus]|uniref:Glycerol-3-phosphate dehydrogenase/oxidase n=1 Tax=Mucilaginibacter rubeus TaxID=2027860 RepID=A0A5C1HYK8_9SPHI|nr:glycerol-3-phosphate dehydrogenase/oxidase [Mucilaginibacter rubeus]QEM10932.1 glycerol-3-phosphate dehydrogenase/oxidase [Mucilaginibacter rubeus]
MNPFTREANLEHLTNTEKIWDLIIIGGGATGLGAAVDAASRGFSTLLLEQADFAKGTSSRATKLVHGGVRYLAQGDIGLVREALRERGLLLNNAPHLVKNESFIIPNYSWWDGVFYTIGLSIYDILAGKLSFGRAKHISKKETIKRLPGIQEKGLHGSVVYHDGQFDDSRLAINLAQTAIEQGATLLNYFKVSGLIKGTSGKIAGVTATDIETGINYELKAKTVINATGVFVDDVLKMDTPEKKPMVRPSQGVHLVLDRSFLPAEDALMIPKTEDGRVLFAVPWHEKLLIGTTDTPIDSHSLEPVALDEEVEFILRTAGKYLTKAPTRADVLSVFAGLRPLAAPQDGSSKTKEISRSHKLIVSDSGLITITGGKWTTYRKMAEDIVNQAIKTGGLQNTPCKTESLAIHGSRPNPDRTNPMFVYGTDIEKIQALYDENPDWKNQINPEGSYTKGEVIWSVRNEMARSVEDILARRTRVLFLNARLAIKMAPEVAHLMAGELGKDTAWETTQINAFNETAKNYILTPH